MTGRAVLPFDVKRIPGGFRPCESCGVRTADVKVTFGTDAVGVSHELCDGCAGDHPKL